MVNLMGGREISEREERVADITRRLRLYNKQVAFSMGVGLVSRKQKHHIKGTGEREREREKARRV